MLGNTNAGLDSRFAQFQGQGQPGAAAAGGYPGLGGNMQALQSLQAGSFGLQNPLQAGGRPGLGGLQGGAAGGGALGAQQRLGAGGAGLAPSLQQLGLGQAGPGARVAMPGAQQFAGVNGERGAEGAQGRGLWGRAADVRVMNRWHEMQCSHCGTSLCVWRGWHAPLNAVRLRALHALRPVASLTANCHLLQCRPGGRAGGARRRRRGRPQPRAAAARTG